MTDEERAAVRAETIAEVKVSIEAVAKGHDDLALRHPGGPDRVKAQALRRFSEVFL